MASTEPTTGRCGAQLSHGRGYCEVRPITGTKRCGVHSGRKGRAGAMAQSRVITELRNWGLGDTHIDPGEQLLRLVAQGASRVDLYSSLLARSYAASERLRDLLRRRAQGEQFDAETTEELKAARDELDGIFRHGGISALVGNTYSATRDGDLYASGEEIRGLARLEMEERKMLAQFASKAVAAGLAERQVRLAEAMAVQLVAVVFGVLEDLGVSGDDLRVREVVSQRLLAIGSGGVAIPAPLSAP